MKMIDDDDVVDSSIWREEIIGNRNPPIDFGGKKSEIESARQFGGKK